MDLEARNDAIYATWVRELMRTDEHRPTWTYVADEILRRSLPLVWQDRCSTTTRILTNMVLQSWTPMTRKMDCELAREGRRTNTQADGLPLELEMQSGTTLSTTPRSGSITTVKKQRRV